MNFIQPFLIYWILAALVNVTFFNVAQAQKAANTLQIDTVYLKAVKSSHFKIKILKVEDLTAYEDLFNTYGKLKTVQIKGKKKQFLGDFKNISRAKYVNNALNRAGITTTKITLFKKWIPPIISKKEKKPAPQKESEKKIVAETVGVKKASSKKQQQKENSNNAFPTRPSTEKKKNIPSAEKNYIKVEDAKLTNRPKQIKDSSVDNGEFILILPKVTNPEIYEYILKDLGTVDHKKLPNEQWYYFLGFFDDEEKAKTLIPKIKARGFTKPPTVVDLKDAEQVALTMYKNLPPIVKKKLATKKKNTAAKKVDQTLFYRIQLPQVSNPEIYFKAFQDIGAGFSEIAPNGKGVYYIGEFQTTALAKKNVAILKERGLSNGTVVKFEHDKRLTPYSEIYLSEAKEAINENVKKVEVKTRVSTNPNGIFQIRLKLVENPEVLKAVFKDVGKLKIGYFDDDTEYYFMGNYLFQKEAETVIEQLKERGLTQFNLLNIMAAGETPKISRAGVRNVYKINLGFLNEEEQSLLRPYGSLSSIIKEDNKVYYLGDYPTKKVANIIADVLKDIGYKKTTLIEFFNE